MSRLFALFGIAASLFVATGCGTCGSGSPADCSNPADQAQTGEYTVNIDCDSGFCTEVGTLVLIDGQARLTYQDEDGNTWTVDWER